MNMTFLDYISNPMGIKNAVYSNREMYKKLYQEKLDKILVREVGRIKYYLYKNSSQDEYYIHMKIPSEVVPNFYYDTIIKFFTTDQTISLSNSLKKYFVKFYSNDPSFVYTFAYAIFKNDLFIKELLPRMSKEAVKKIAKEKNPKADVGYVKSIYFAYLLIDQYNLFSKDIFNNTCIEYSQKKLLSSITHSDTMIRDRQEKGEKLRKSKSRAKKVEKKEISSMHNIARNPFLSAPSSVISKVSNVSKIAHSAIPSKLARKSINSISKIRPKTKF